LYALLMMCGSTTRNM